MFKTFSSFNPPVTYIVLFAATILCAARGLFNKAKEIILEILESTINILSVGICCLFAPPIKIYTTSSLSRFLFIIIEVHAPAPPK